ncbi:MAG: lysozyme inhibitor LprI family protein [Telluria sp.]
MNPNKRMAWMAIAAAASWGVQAWAAPHPGASGGSGFADVARQCEQVRYLRPPPADLPRTSGPLQCDAGLLYYQAATKVARTDSAWDKVRDCAFRTNDSAILMMLYANGSGVAPNLGLAMKYACATPGSQLDVRNRLTQLKRQARQGSFDCTEAASARLRDLCGGVRLRQASASDKDELAALAKTWTPKERVGLDMAREAMRYFAEHRADYETDQGGKARARLHEQALSEEFERFADDIQDFQTGRTPRFTEAEFKALEEKMNRAYKEFMDTQPSADSYLGSIGKPGVEKTQRAWLAYRDAMELFGSIKYPDVPASGWRALLTSRRIRQLSELTAAAQGR